MPFAYLGLTANTNKVYLQPNIVNPLHFVTFESIKKNNVNCMRTLTFVSSDAIASLTINKPKETMTRRSPENFMLMFCSEMVTVYFRIMIVSYQLC